MQSEKKRKIVKTSPPKIDPNKIKKPECRGGGSYGPHPLTVMEFSPVRQKWVCPFAGCRMTAKPARDPDEKTVELGKGEVSLRIVCHNNNTSVLFISDDNLALDVTRYVDVEELLRTVQVMDLAESAVDNARGEFNFRPVVPFKILTRIGVIGAESLVEQFKDKV